MDLVRIKLQKLAKLPENWDSYGALRISPVALAATDLLLNLLILLDTELPSVVPLTDGGIQLEWCTKNCDIEAQINADGQLEDVWGEYK